MGAHGRLHSSMQRQLWLVCAGPSGALDGSIWAGAHTTGTLQFAAATRQPESR